MIFASLAALLALVPSLVWAQAAASHLLHDYVHTVWTQHEGVPLGGIVEIFQSRDGYLWLVSRQEGLMHFDGMRFVRVSTPCTDHIGSGAAVDDGGLWILCGRRLFRRTSHGEFVEVAYTQSSTIESSPQALHVDRQGRPWLVGNGVEYWEPDGTRRQEHLSVTGHFDGFAQDVDGTFWFTDGERIVRVDGVPAETIALPGAYNIVSSSDGGILAVTHDHLWRVRSGMPPASVAATPPGMTFSNLDETVSRAPDGGIWLGTRQHGVVLLQNARVVTMAAPGGGERFVLSLLVDNEGTVWAGTSSGLHRFRKRSVRFLPRTTGTGPGVPTVVFVDAQDRVWLGPGENNGVRRLSSGGEVTTVAAGGGLVRGIAEDGSGRIWLSKGNEIGYVDGVTFGAVRDAATRAITGVWSFARDHRGDLWGLSEDVGVYRITPGPPRLVIKSPNAHSRFLVSERFGIWIGQTTGGVERHAGDLVQRFRDDSLSVVDDIPRTIAEAMTRSGSAPSAP